MSQHQFYEPNDSVVERQADGSLTPFPSKELNDRQGHSGLTLDSVLGIRTGVDGVVWMLDNGMRGGVTRQARRLGHQDRQTAPRHLSAGSDRPQGRIRQ